MKRRSVVFEGYDGSGKSSLIDAVRASLVGNDIRVVGRKTEPELLGISSVLEREDLRPLPNVEVLLRIALEIERQCVIDRSLRNHDMVFCDRGMISLLSWFDYLHVAREQYEPLLQGLMDYHCNSLTVVCEADFDTCWTRVNDRSIKSWKERQGFELNRRYFAMYENSVRCYAATGADLVFIDTAQSSLAESADHIKRVLDSRGL
ncbi:AAA family ATPase [Actinomadura sp. 7K534]|uniref:AAA family ATPase n=1 Tax=Actinomadura sp. 7K534 TaxID=2530366 RepID=UPI001048D066|nr:AAA family ATPase [Actinomadura sp. 7K534]TDB93195.1 hypothetical protein E1266_21315 [Actinomadura sp. 7K534]